MPPPSPPPASILAEDLLVEILSRVPYSSLCRFKCVSKSWLALCSDPALRRKSSQTLSGFFYRLVVTSGQPLEYQVHFTNVSGRGRPMINPSLSFMPGCKRIEIIDTSSGLLLCRCVKMSPEHEYDYVVCNPAIEKWIPLPYRESMEGVHTVRLGFDPAASCHFRVFLLVKNVQDQDQYCQVTGVEVYSSTTGAWTCRESEWGDNCRVHDATKSVFLNGVMHFTTDGSFK